MSESMTLNDVMDIIDNEGFDYGFVYYSNFEGVDNPKFHELRNKFINARKELSKYLELMTERESE